MKYGINLLLWTTDVTEQHFPLLDQIKHWGYEGVEIPVFDLNVNKFKRLGAALDSTGLQRTAVTVSTPEANPIGETVKIRKAAVDRLKQVIDLCHTAGATKLCGPFHSALGQFTGKGPTADEWSRAKEVLSQVADHAKKAGITLVLEYLNRFECYFLTCAADCARFVNEVNHPNLRMMYDTFHANIEEKCPAAAIKTCAPVMVHVHISESDRSTPGEGNVDWDTTFAALKSVNYEGWLMVEAFGLALPDLAAATKIWRKMFPTEEHLATNALRFMKNRWNS
jgi:D-psicose/D-tagatose/L-ribulose 3-epimerase